MLDQVLARLPRASDPDLLVGFATSDDAGVYRLTPECALVQTVDFFTPILDDPATFGAIAAANALSDVWAMGGAPRTALSILACPSTMNPEILASIITGGVEKLGQGGCVLAGGHSVQDPELKFGFAVTGVVHPDRIWRNAGAQPGDVLVLTKPLGTGVIATAAKRGIAPDGAMDAAVRSMLELNRDAAAHFLNLRVHACTDVTGFGLLGHAREMALASNVSLEIDAASVPLLPGALVCAELGALAGGLKNNRAFAGSCVHSTVSSDALEAVLYDPQTSGGLLLSVPPGAPHPYTVIGRVHERGPHPIHVR